MKLTLKKPESFQNPKILQDWRTWVSTGSNWDFWDYFWDYFWEFFKTYLEETRVISESRDSAGLNDMGGGVATGSNCTLWFDSAEFFLLLIWQPESGVLESLGMAVSLVTDGGLLLILLLLFVIFLLFGSTKCVET